MVKQLEPFSGTVEAWREDLTRYCLKITGSAWDAEDLVQETLIRAYRFARRNPERPINRAYIFRIASNAWIDMCRRKKIESDVYDEEYHITYNEWNKHDTREALETLLERLQPRQAVVVLLIDVFDFTAQETACMLDATEGAVKAVLHRARAKLRSLAAETKEATVSDNRSAENVSYELFEAFVDAFRQRDPYAIFRAYRVLQHCRITVEKIDKDGPVLSFYFKDPDGNVLMVRN